MDPQSTYQDLPWQLIVSALQGELSPADSAQLEAWLAASPANRERYGRLVRLWKEGMEDYVGYETADPDRAWEALRQRLGEDASLLPTPPLQEGATVPEARTVFHPRLADKLARVRRWTLAAALVLLSVGIGLWQYLGRQQVTQYATTIGQQRTIALPDGSTVVLGPQTHFQLPRKFNKTDRTVILLDGQAHFDVVHQTQQPFIVDMDLASVRDIGTSFTITRTADSIIVAVSAGRIAFREKETGETREVSAGGSLCLYTTQHRGQIRVIAAGDALRWDDAPLSQVIDALEKHYGTTIRLEDTTIAQKRLTIHLDGESLEHAIQVICVSLNLQSAPDGTGYILRNSAGGSSK